MLRLFGDRDLLCHLISVASSDVARDSVAEFTEQSQFLFAVNLCGKYNYIEAFIVRLLL